MGEAAQIVIGGLLQGSVFAVVALGFTLVFRVTGAINLSQGAFCILGALAMYSLEVSFGWPVWLAAIGATLATTLLGLVIGASAFVPALSRLPTSSLFILTAGLLSAYAYALHNWPVAALFWTGAALAALLATYRRAPWPG